MSDPTGGFLPLLLKVDNIAVLVMLIVLFYFGWTRRDERKEDREDRRQMVDAINRNTDALTKLQIVVASVTGRAPV